MLVVDAAQGVEAQTVANAYLAIENDLELLPVVNKIDLPQADPDAAAAGDRRADRRRPRRRPPDLGQDRPGDRGRPRRGGRADPAAVRRPRRAGARADLRLVVRPVPRRRRVRSCRRRLLPHRRGAARNGAGNPVRGGGARLLLAHDARGAKRSTPARSGYVITGLKDVSRLRVGDTLTSRANPAAGPLPGYKDVKPMVFAGLFPTDSDEYPELRDALEKLKLNDAALVYEPETSQRPRLRLPLRLPRPAAHGDRPRAPRAGVRPRPARDRAQRRLPGPDPGGRGGRGAQPRRDAAGHRAGRGAVHPRLDHRPEGVRRPGDGALHRAAGPLRPHGVPLRGAPAPDLRAAARRGRRRLLRPAEVADARVRQLRLRRDRLPRGRASSSSTS